MSFSDIIGQDRTIKILENTIQSQKIANAYIFVGENSSGRKKTALEFAKTLNCKNLADFTSCETCQNCKKINNRTHPEIKIWNEENKNISIDDIKEIQKELQYKKTEAIFRFVIIDNAEKMSREAANSFLKTLEEPPLFTVIILIVKNLSNLLKTIVSRCQIVKLKDLTQDEKVQVLSKNLNQDAKAIENALLISGNNLEEAKNLLSGEKNDETSQKFLEIYESLNQKNFSSQMQKNWENLAKDKEIFENFLSFIINKNANFSSKKNAKNLELFLKAKHFFDRNVSPKLIWIWIYSQLANS